MRNEKTCTTCGETKATDMFTGTGTDASYKTSTSVLCKSCNAEQARIWRKKNPGYRGSGKIISIPPEDRLLASAISERLVGCKQRTKKRNHPVPVDVTREYLYELFKEQDRRCALSGVELKIEKGAVTCLSLDQIDTSKGYIEGNVQWVAWAVNRAKGDMPTDVFIDMCSQILDYQKVQRLSKSAA